RFFDPFAKALVEQRRDLLWNGANAGRIGLVLRAISHNPEAAFREMANYNTLRQIIQNVDRAKDAGLGPDDIDALAESLWLLALEIEEGDLADARDALERAQDKLEQAIRDGASPAEIQRLMDELRQAQRDYMREFAERNPLDPQQQRDRQDGEGANPDQDIVTQDELAEMMQELQELMEQGRMAEAQELLEEINRLMENLQMTEGQAGQDGSQSEGQQSMQDLADTLRQQQELSDEAFRDLQNGGRQNQQQPGQQGQQGQDGEQGQQPGQQQGQNGQQQGQQGQQGQGSQPGENGTQGQTLAERQQALRDMLSQQRRGLPAPGNDAGDAARRSLEDAEGAMDRAERNLRDGDIPGAIDNQSQAMDALREGMRNLGRALAEEQQQGQGENQLSQQQPGQGQSGQQDEIDPLGRNNGNPFNQPGPDGEMITQQDLMDRSQELSDEIQRRGAELDRPAQERGYLERLIEDPF
ncbi:MAG: DUF4175 family protein, partial [Pseudomonadota bacterium]